MFDGSVYPHYTLTRIFRLVFVTPLLVNSVNLFLYAIYIFLFRRALSILKSRNSFPELRFYRIILVLLFALASIGVPISLVDDLISAAEILWAYEGVELPARSRDVVDDLDICRYCILLVMALAADSIMIFRCYVLWGYKKRYVVGPLVGLILIDLTAVITGALSLSGPRILKVMGNGCLAANGVLNLILASMIAARLLWVSRLRGNSLEKATVRRLNSIVSILLESGFLIVIAMAVDVVGNLLPVEYGFDAGSVLIQVAGIAPTLVVIRTNEYRGDSEAGVNIHVQNGNTTGDLESRPELVDLQVRPRS
ncbi:hypothetical protein PM082_009841 [Marasmius tenuissimus]|nr:hypothetical protein PM082_009841 [Marasmius tenuissimus]